MVVPELRPWRAAGPHAARVAAALRPRLARVAATLAPPLARLRRNVSARATPSGAPRDTEAAGPRGNRVARAVQPQVARLVQATKARVGHLRGTRPKPGPNWRYTAGATTVGLALAAGVVTAAGPWDSSGQRTAERDHAVALDRTGGADHGPAHGPTHPGDAVPGPAPSAAAVLAGLGGYGGATGNTVKSAPQAAAPDPAALATVLGPLLGDPALGPVHTAAVVDVATGRLLYGSGADQALTPASTTKIATAVAALSAMGPDHRLTTRTAFEPDTGELVLVGGGDPTLTARPRADGWASLRTLAGSTAAALKKRGIERVTLSYDTTLFAGSGRHPIGENGNLALVTALAADEARTDDSTSGPVQRYPDPAAQATNEFAAFLNAAGITTSPPGPSKASTRAETLATVSSPPLSALVERMLTYSDNDIAEALARQTALATGVRADFAGGGTAIGAQLKKLGLPTAGAVFHDGSGLDRTDKLTARLLTALLTKAADPTRPGLRPALTGLPVARFTGTLSTRFVDGPADGAAGVVRAKTGTLSGVNTLSGMVVDQDGRLLAFAFLTADPDSPEAAPVQAALDRVATALAGCGCG
ncbi:D-alanyl-D-alanine carboxypeptidase/D-alanyl-D-alanine endopeptidase [Streptomyces longwoodensis]|uniref:D-alanyl-D-alanine carboxypeptidase/D-alanyl-D-alanine endopeptidase n=1 Tax=Streptomyces longwoodensis TaxID=68231 RepID=UPI0022521FAB|nr:D-alanyl-D-alanine carboxypeptidase/D-alanyl-D-alanine-endopeptidase [Streptomyces longwoodensis]MCX4995107.1 D-alanyl-D-alanine carboxypeptidase/D-alanyl-D-alanine-endopeptidase [Streptomyces longwoodensis]